MYSAHFGLREAPFGITPDTSFFFGSPGSQEALNTLLVAARGGEGFIKITGEVGTGKTLLCRKFMDTLGEDFVTAYIPNPYLEPRTLMLALADELEIGYEKNIDQHHLLKAITQGVLRLVNILAHKALMLCYGQGRSRVERAHVLAAARDTLSTSSRQRRWPWMAAGTLLASLLAAGATWALMR